MNTLFQFSLHTLSALSLTVVLSACATTTPKTESPAEDPPTPAPQVTAPFSQFNQNNSDSTSASTSKSKTSLGTVVRDLNETGGLSLVLMNGLENIQVSKEGTEGVAPKDSLEFLLRSYQLTRYSTDHYTFIYAPEYEVLTTLQLAKQLPKKYTQTRVDIAFGANTPLFSALALISHSTGLTLLADQAMGDSLCGELNLLDTPLPLALEALLQSARIQPDALKVRSSNDYIFLHSAAHPLRAKVQLATISEAMKKELQEKSSISLMVYTPAGNEVSSQLGSSKLNTVLSELSLQLGISVKAEGKVNQLPVNPMVMNNLPRETVLELFLHQWMLPIFAYEEQDGNIVLRHAGKE